MPQFFLPAKALKEKAFILEGPEAYHLVKVLRCREGEEIELFDGRGGKYRGKIVAVRGDGSVEGAIAETLASPTERPKVRLTLYPALLKASRWEWLLEKGTEIGVGAFQPVVTQRTIVLLHEAERLRVKGDRWGKIVLAAAKQCGRAELPTVGPPIPLRDALAQAQKRGPILFAWEGMAGSSARPVLKEALRFTEGSGLPSVEKTPNEIGLFIGPEGGFTAEEAELTQAYGATPFALGASVLRGETAAITAASLILYELGAI